MQARPAWIVCQKIISLQRWDEMRWDEMRWDEMRWDEMRWDMSRIKNVPDKTETNTTTSYSILDMVSSIKWNSSSMISNMISCRTPRLQDCLIAAVCDASRGHLSNGLFESECQREMIYLLIITINAIIHNAIFQFQRCINATDDDLLHSFLRRRARASNMPNHKLLACVLIRNRFFRISRRH